MLEFANANAQLLADLQQIHNRSSRAFEQIVTQRVGSMSHDVLADITHQNQTLYQAIDHVNQEVLQQHRHHNDAIIESNMQFQNDVSARIQDVNGRTFHEFSQKVDSIIDGIREDRQVVVDMIASSTRDLQNTISSSLKSLADSITKLTDSMAQSQGEVLTLLRNMSSSHIEQSDSKRPLKPLHEINLDAYERELNRKNKNKHKTLKKKAINMNLINLRALVAQKILIQVVLKVIVLN